MKRYLTTSFLACVIALFGAARAQEKAVRSDDALAYLTIDIERTAGWVAKLKGGYQWKLFRHVGLDLNGGGSVGHQRNYTKDGPVGSVMLGYNFGHFPLTIGLEFGFGPSGKMEQTSAVTGGTLYSKQKVNIYTLDLSVDYDFRNCSRWTPFVGVIGGGALVEQSGEARFIDAGGSQSFGSLDKHKRINFMAGARVGVKYAINDRLTLSLYSSYNYLGRVQSRNYAVVGAAGAWDARTRKITAHSADVKAGLKVSF